MSMPDKTFPNQKIVFTILQCIDRLPISSDELTQIKELEQILEIYSSGVAGQGYSECANISQQILNKWSRDRYGIETRYDPAGHFDEGWENLQLQLDHERKKNKKKDSEK